MGSLGKANGLMKINRLRSGKRSHYNSTHLLISSVILICATPVCY